MNNSNTVLLAIAGLAATALIGVILLAAIGANTPEALNGALYGLMGLLPGFVVGQRVGVTQEKVARIEEKVEGQ